MLNKSFLLALLMLVQSGLVPVRAGQNPLDLEIAKIYMYWDNPDQNPPCIEGGNKEISIPIRKDNSTKGTYTYFVIDSKEKIKLESDRPHDFFCLKKEDKKTMHPNNNTWEHSSLYDYKFIYSNPKKLTDYVTTYDLTLQYEVLSGGQHEIKISNLVYSVEKIFQTSRTTVFLVRTELKFMILFLGFDDSLSQFESIINTRRDEFQYITK